MNVGFHGLGVGVEGVPGFVPRVLRDGEVGLLRAEDRAFDAMVEGWRAQMLARGLTRATIDGRCRVRRRFQEFASTLPCVLAAGRSG